jgi:hypothetical protein
MTHSSFLIGIRLNEKGRIFPLQAHLFENYEPFGIKLEKIICLDSKLLNDSLDVATFTPQGFRSCADVSTLGRNRRTTLHARANWNILARHDMLNVNAEITFSSVQGFEIGSLPQTSTSASAEQRFHAIMQSSIVSDSIQYLQLAVCDTVKIYSSVFQQSSRFFQ